MISGTNGLLGAADGAFLLHKEKRTSNSAVLEISGRDQQDQKLYLMRNMERLTWELEKKETELWKEPQDSMLENISRLLSDEKTEWSGSATELATLIGENIQPNIMTRKLNVKAGRLLSEYGIEYAARHTRDGSYICLKRQM